MSRAGNTSPSRRSRWNIQNKVDHGEPMTSRYVSTNGSNGIYSPSSNGTIHSNHLTKKTLNLRRAPGSGNTSRKRQRWLTFGEAGQYRTMDSNFICRKSLLSKCIPIFVLVLWVYIVLTTTTLLNKASSSFQQNSSEGLSNGFSNEYLKNKDSHNLRNSNRVRTDVKRNNIPHLVSYQELLGTSRSATTNNQTVIVIPFQSDLDLDSFSRQLKLLPSKNEFFRVMSISSEVQKQFMNQNMEACHFSSLTMPSSEEGLRILFQSCYLYRHGGFFVNLEKVQFLSSFKSTMGALSQSNSGQIALVQDEKFGMYPHAMLFPSPGSDMMKKVLQRLSQSEEFFGSGSDNMNNATTSYSRMLSDAYYESSHKERQRPLLLRQRCLPTCVDGPSIFCCHVSFYSQESSRILFATKQLHNAQIVPFTQKDVNLGEHTALIENPSTSSSSSITVIIPEVHNKQISFPQLTPNFYHIMNSGECLPSNRHCRKCLAEEGRCTILCKKLCPCYCAALCHTDIQEKFLSHSFYVIPPKREGAFVIEAGYDHKDQTSSAMVKSQQENNAGIRHIPKIIHQIWIKPESKIFGSKPHPEMSRIMNTWKISGWDHRLYHLEDDIPRFLTEHFPPQVLEAYDSIGPLRFKSDFARLCLLLIHGGIYADPDVLLNTNLENAIPHDAGFLAAVDFVNPKDKERRDFPSPCLSNELLVSAPGHPFIAKALEYIVNGIRNRFTSVDYDDLQCPTPHLNLTYYYANHYTTGSCALGAAVNDVLGRPKSSVFDAGVININDDKSVLDRSAVELLGKTIILHSKHKDMGTLRFTLKDENILLANRMKRAISDWPTTYQYTSAPSGNEIQYVYGSKGVYKDTISANENIRFVVGRPPPLRPNSAL